MMLAYPDVFPSDAALELYRIVKSGDVQAHRRAGFLAAAELALFAGGQVFHDEEQPAAAHAVTDDDDEGEEKPKKSRQGAGGRTTRVSPKDEDGILEALHSHGMSRLKKGGGEPAAHSPMAFSVPPGVLLEYVLKLLKLFVD
jgi:hypothetical protein